jgi:uncharacterized membrane protein YkoI
MIKARTASVLVIGAMAAVAVGSGVALASSGGDDPAPPSRAAVDGTLTDDPSPSPSRSADDSGDNATDRGFDSGLGAPDSPSPSASASSPSASSPGGGSAIGAAQARTIAIRAAGGGRVTEIERETEHGRAVWDVEVYRGGVEHDIDVDRATGEVLRHKTDREDDRGRDDDRGDDDSGRDDDRGRGGDDDHGDDHGSGGHGSDD